MSELPEWFTGEVHTKGEVVKHPVTGKPYPLTATELSMYNYLTGAQLITEIGINHQGNFEMMKEMMKAAKSCGVDYVKSQKREPKVCLTKEQYKRPYDSPHSFGKTYGEHKENLE